MPRATTRVRFAGGAPRLDHDWLVARFEESLERGGVQRLASPEGGDVAMKFSRPASALRPSPARRAFDAALALVDGGAGALVATPRALVEGTLCAYVYDWIEGETIHDRGGPDASDAAPVARAVAALHAANVRHKDLNGSNLVLVAGGDVRFVDLDAASTTRGSPGTRVRARDLARVALTWRVHDVAFDDVLDVYVEVARVTASQRRAMERAIERRVTRWLESARGPLR